MKLERVNPTAMIDFCATNRLKISLRHFYFPGQKNFKNLGAVTGGSNLEVSETNPRAALQLITVKITLVKFKYSI